MTCAVNGREHNDPFGYSQHF